MIGVNTSQSHMRKAPVMSKVRSIGLDVHADAIAVPVAEPMGDVRSIPHDLRMTHMGRNRSGVNT